MKNLKEALDTDDDSAIKELFESNYFVHTERKEELGEALVVAVESKKPYVVISALISALPPINSVYVALEIANFNEDVDVISALSAYEKIYG